MRAVGLSLQDISIAYRSETGPGKFHKLPKSCEWIIIDMAFIDYILGAVMEMLWVGRYSPPVCIRKIIMTVHCAIDMPPLPMIGEAASSLDGEPYIDKGAVL
jgi:hypothetical protein